MYLKVYFEIQWLTVLHKYVTFPIKLTDEGYLFSEKYLNNVGDTINWHISKITKICTGVSLVQTWQKKFQKEEFQIAGKKLCQVVQG